MSLPAWTLNSLPSLKSLTAASSFDVERTAPSEQSADTAPFIRLNSPHDRPEQLNQHSKPRCTLSVVVRKYRREIGPSRRPTSSLASTSTPSAVELKQLCSRAVPSLRACPLAAQATLIIRPFGLMFFNRGCQSAVP